MLLIFVALKNVCSLICCNISNIIHISFHLKFILNKSQAFWVTCTNENRRKGFFKMNSNSERFYSNLKTFKRCSDSCVKSDDRTYYVCFFSEKEGKVKCCDLCLQRNLRKKQTHFCKTKSEVPKALCKDCAHQHTR